MHWQFSIFFRLLLRSLAEAWGEGVRHGGKLAFSRDSVPRTTGHCPQLQTFSIK